MGGSFALTGCWPIRYTEGRWLMKWNVMRQIARVLQRLPWLVVIARVFWRFWQAKFTAGAVGIVFNSSGEVLLVEHVFHPYAPWGLPGGWVDRRESPATTVQRELREELGLKVQVDTVVLVDLDFGDHLDFAYLCHSSNGVGALSRELLGFQWCALDALPKLQTFHYRAIQAAAERAGIPYPKG